MFKAYNMWENPALVYQIWYPLIPDGLITATDALQTELPLREHVIADSFMTGRLRQLPHVNKVTKSERCFVMFACDSVRSLRLCFLGHSVSRMSTSTHLCVKKAALFVPIIR